MKKLFTFAIISMVASLMFAVLPLAMQKGDTNATANNETAAAGMAKAPEGINEADYTLLEINSHRVSYTVSDGDWYWEIWVAPNDAKYLFDVVNNDPSSFEGTYTLDDMDSKYSYQVNPKSYYKEAIFSVTADGDNVASIDAYVTLETGEKLHLKYGEAIETEKEMDGNITITRGDHNEITGLKGGTSKSYERSATGKYYTISEGKATEHVQPASYISMLEDGENVWIKDPIVYYVKGTWVKGTKSGNTVVIPTGQLLGYDAASESTIGLRYATIDAEGNAVPADDYADSFVYAVEDGVWTLQNTDEAHFMAAITNSAESATVLAGEAQTVLNYDAGVLNQTTTLVTIPYAAEREDWLMNAEAVNNNNVSKTVEGQNVTVAFNGDDVYIKGLFGVNLGTVNLAGSMGNGVIKGTKTGNSIMFRCMQYQGKYGQDMYMIGNAKDAYTNVTATYDEENHTITFDAPVLLSNMIQNAYVTMNNVVLKQKPDPVIITETTTFPYDNNFDTSAKAAEVAVHDANQDGNTWRVSGQALKYTYAGNNAADDYAAFPGIPMTRYTTYRISFETSASRTSNQTLKLLVGTSGKVSALNAKTLTTVSSFTENAEKNYIEFTPTADGNYYFAFLISGTPSAYGAEIIVDNFDVYDPARPATLPIKYDGGRYVEDDMTLTGATQTGLGTDRSSSPKLNFATTGANLVMNFEDASDVVLQYNIMKSSTASGTFKVQESADGVTYTDVVSYSTSNIGTSAKTETKVLTAGTRYVKFIFSSRSRGNIYVGKINIFQGNVRTGVVANDYGTICLPYAVTAATGAKFYSIDGIEGGIINMSEVAQPKAGKPYIIQASATTIVSEYTGNAVSAPASDAYLTGVFEDTQAPVGAYVMQKQNGKIGFYEVENIQPTIKANRAYLNASAGAGARAIFFDGDETAIEAVEALSNGKAQIYDLQGRKLNSLQKGINIVNGVKILVK